MIELLFTIVVFSFSTEINLEVVSFDCIYDQQYPGLADGIEYSPTLTTQHLHLELFSTKYYQYMSNLWKATALFNDICERNNFVYTVHSGNLIGLYRENKQLFWDDDVDVVMKESDFNFFHELWKQSVFEKTESRGVGLMWEIRRVPGYNGKIQILQPKKFSEWFKLRYEPYQGYYDNLPDVGGVDIERCKWDDEVQKCVEMSDNVLHGIDNSQNFLFPKPHENFDDFQKLCLCGIEIRALKKERGEKWLNGKFPNWRVRKGPTMLENDFGFLRRYTFAANNYTGNNTFNNNTRNTTLSGGAIAAIAFGSVIGATALICCCLLCCLLCLVIVIVVIAVGVYGIMVATKQPKKIEMAEQPTSVESKSGVGQQDVIQEPEKIMQGDQEGVKLVESQI